MIVTDCVFGHNYDGVIFNHGNLTVTNNRFSDGNTHVQILETLRPWTYRIRNNTFDNYVGVGVLANRIFPSLSFYLTDNAFSNNFSGVGSQGAASFISTNTANTNIFVLDNTCDKTSGQNDFFGGFVFQLGNNSLVEGNDFTSTGGSLVELYLEATRSAKVYRNSFIGALSNDKGIQAIDAYRSSIICNTVGELSDGTSFEGHGCDGTVLAENIYGNHNIGLSLTSNTTIGQQIYNKNVWPTSGSPLEAEFPVPISDPAYLFKIGNSKVVVQVAESSSPNYWAIPRYPTANDWFQHAPTSQLFPLKCPAEYVEPGDGGGDEGGGRGLSATDENVINGTQPIYNGFDATLWDAQVRLYRNLYEYPELRQADSEAEDFYSANSESSYAHLAIILSKYDQAMTANKIDLEQLADLYVQAQEAQEEQTGNLDALNQAAALLLSDIDVTRNEQLDILQNELAALEVSTEYEANLKSSLLIMITSALSDSPWHWTPEQEFTLQSIAAQCKLSGGYGVLLARLMLGLSIPQEEGCIIEDRDVQVLGRNQGDWKISPNPTTGYLQISLSKNADIRTLVLYDQWGHITRSRQVGNELVFHWNLGDLTNGVYFLKIIGGKETYTVQKIIIQH